MSTSSPRLRGNYHHQQPPVKASECRSLAVVKRDYELHRIAQLRDSTIVLSHNEVPPVLPVSNVMAVMVMMQYGKTRHV